MGSPAKNRRGIHGWGAVPPSLLAAALCAMLLFYGDAVREGVRAGLVTCADVIIPSLYLFMAVAGFIAQSPAASVLGAPFSFFTRHVLKLPQEAGAAVVLSFLGGYPVGAKSLQALLQGGRLNERQAGRALCFCCNAGPSFVVTAVGARMLGSARFGAALLLAHIFSALLLGAFLSRKEPVPPKGRERAPALPFSQAFLEGVNGATAGILSICAFVVVFSACGALLEACGATAAIARALGALPFAPGEATVRAFIVGLLEVTSGCVAAAALPGRLPFLLAPLFVSFAGFSIYFQVRACLRGYSLRYGRFLCCRAAHALLTLAFCLPFVPGGQGSVQALAGGAPPVPYRTPNTPLGVLALLGVLGAALLALTAPLYRPAGARQKKPPENSRNFDKSLLE